MNRADDGGGGEDSTAGGDGGVGTGGGADVSANVDGDGGDGDDVTSGTDAAIDDLFGVNRMRHPLSLTASEERPVVRRKRRSKWITRHVDSDKESAGRSSKNSSDRISLSVMVLLLRAASRECF